MFFKNKKPKPQVFAYGYLRHPFDDLQKFYVEAMSQEDADNLAREKYVSMFNNRQVCTVEFWRTTPSTNIREELFDMNNYMERFFHRFVFTCVALGSIIALICSLYGKYN